MFTLIIDSSADLGSAHKLAIKAVQNLPLVLKGLPANVWLDDINNADVENVIVNEIDRSKTRSRWNALKPYAITYSIECNCKDIQPNSIEPKIVFPHFRKTLKIHQSRRPNRWRTGPHDRHGTRDRCWQRASKQ